MKQAALPTSALLLAGTLAENELAAAVDLAFGGIAPKEISPSLLAQCIRKVHAGGFRLVHGGGAPPSSSAMGRQTASGGYGRTPTPQELEVVRLICKGLGNTQIGKRLRISEATVKTHLHRIYEKLRLRDRLQLSLYGREKGLG